MNLIMARATIEALIFAASEPLNSKTIAEIINIDEHTVKQLINDLIEDYRRMKRGIQINEVANGYQFCTHPECAPYLEKLMKTPRNVGLSQAAIETLAIIAYKQPITKAEIESLRGVSIESPLNTLIEKNLIEEAGRKDGPGRPILYRTSKKFLHYFGLNDLNELPRISDWIGQNSEPLPSAEEEGVIESD
ncbi:MAG TPA: SMC-Scp complex subunit ScpB [Bacillota bacterium]|nr:SMC-Scp complex subunit ScpB [Bacillota bacterium]HOL11006.1 SMC-Scp complex subunit ScpB [Bacillota bacterium]HPO97459.1 SMC-Scp complex subunit ScpB [Bacillota bacterium]